MFVLMNIDFLGTLMDTDVVGHETAQVFTKNYIYLQKSSSASKAFAGNHPWLFLCCMQPQYLVGKVLPGTSSN